MIQDCVLSQPITSPRVPKLASPIKKLSLVNAATNWKRGKWSVVVVKRDRKLTYRVVVKSDFNLAERRRNKVNDSARWMSVWREPNIKWCTHIPGILSNQVGWPFPNSSYATTIWKRGLALIKEQQGKKKLLGWTTALDTQLAAARVTLLSPQTNLLLGIYSNCKYKD